ncbi:efflux RND transporter periplasmic adaptor subunit [Eudoraea adriatica]|uniref:efflux RND transporter periplasmic adaptor subunit n=1 Tax=Eudoraea adriatica TaxID=446681 RepID=UPI00036052D5|nr:efflux RND transporter periplasmic adaptor subunit [Eudoraea adriatica]
MNRILYYFIPLILLIGITSCKNAETNAISESQKNAEPGDTIIELSKEQFEQNGMSVSSLEEKVFPEMVQANGLIDVPPANRAVVSAPLGGYIKNTHLLIGDRVRKGQTLGTIENPDFVSLQQEYLEIKEQLTYLKSEYERQQILIKENISSQKSFLRAESDYKKAEATYNGLRKQLDLLNISPKDVEKGIISTTSALIAPISGSITQVNVSLGTYVSPATPIIEIVDNEHIHLEISVFEKDIMKIQKGQEILFKIPEASEETYRAEVYLIGNAIEENRTIRVHGHLKDISKHNFLTGMFVSASIITSDKGAMSIPTEALVSLNDSSYLLLLETENDTMYRFKLVKVETGDAYNGYTAIKSTDQLPENARILTKGAFSLVGE